MTTDQNAQPQTGNVLDGLFFHSINTSGHVEWQGHVIGSPQPGWYLVQLFEWLEGDPNVCRLARLEDMQHWLFYADAQSMNFSYEHGVARAGGKYRP